jgi:hypothetical protein
MNHRIVNALDLPKIDMNNLRFSNGITKYGKDGSRFDKHQINIVEQSVNNSVILGKIAIEVNNFEAYVGHKSFRQYGDSKVTCLMPVHVKGDSLEALFTAFCGKQGSVEDIIDAFGRRTLGGNYNNFLKKPSKNNNTSIFKPEMRIIKKEADKSVSKFTVYPKVVDGRFDMNSKETTRTFMIDINFSKYAPSGLDFVFSDRNTGVRNAFIRNVNYDCFSRYTVGRKIMIKRLVMNLSDVWFSHKSQTFGYSMIPVLIDCDVTKDTFNTELTRGYTEANIESLNKMYTPINNITAFIPSCIVDPINNDQYNKNNQYFNQIPTGIQNNQGTQNIPFNPIGIPNTINNPGQTISIPQVNVPQYNPGQSGQYVSSVVRNPQLNTSDMKTILSDVNQISNPPFVQNK